MALQVPAKTSAQQKIVNTVRKGQQNGSLAERAKAILARPNALTSMGMINPRVVNKEEAGIVAEYRASLSPTAPQQRGPVGPPSVFQERKAMTGPQGLLQMAKGAGRGGLEAAELWQEEVIKPTTGAASFLFSPSVREEYRRARGEGQSMREALGTGWEEGLTDTPWGLKGAAELLLDPLNLVPVIGFPGAIAKGAKAGAKFAAPAARKVAAETAQVTAPIREATGALRPQQAYAMPPEGTPGAGIGAQRTEEIGKQAEQARQTADAEQLKAMVKPEGADQRMYDQLVEYAPTLTDEQLEETIKESTKRIRARGKGKLSDNAKAIHKLGVRIAEAEVQRRAVKAGRSVLTGPKVKGGYGAGNIVQLEGSLESRGLVKIMSVEKGAKGDVVVEYVDSGRTSVMSKRRFNHLFDQSATSLWSARESMRRMGLEATEQVATGTTAQTAEGLNLVKKGRYYYPKRSDGTADDIAEAAIHKVVINGEDRFVTSMKQHGGVGNQWFEYKGPNSWLTVDLGYPKAKEYDPTAPWGFSRKELVEKLTAETTEQVAEEAPVIAREAAEEATEGAGEAAARGTAEEVTEEVTEEVAEEATEEVAEAAAREAAEEVPLTARQEAIRSVLGASGRGAGRGGADTATGSAVPPPRQPKQGAKIMGDLSDFNTIVDVMTRSDMWRALANKPVLRSIMGRFNPAAVANSAAAQSVIGRAMLLDQAQTLSQGALARLNGLGTQEKLFGKLDDAGLISSGKLRGVSVNDIRANVGKYADRLSPEQKRWVQVAEEVEKDKLRFLKENGIDVKELGFEEGGTYAGRRLYAKILRNGEKVDAGFIGSGPSRVGAKMGAEKTRMFRTAKEAIDAGYRYIPDDEALFLNVQAAYKRVADKKMSDWLLDRVPWRTMKSSEGLKVAAHQAVRRERQAILLLGAIRRAVRGERLSPGTLKSIGSGFPEEAQELRGLITKLQEKVPRTAKEVKALEERAKDLVMQAKDEARFAERKRAASAEQARRTVIGEGRVEQPAFAGKIFTGPEAEQTAKVLREALDPQFSNALDAVNKVNSVARYFALAGDISTATIQLLYLAGSDPVRYAKAMKGFVKAFWDPQFQANYLAQPENMAIIQKYPNLVLTRGGSTEFTEAMAQGGVLRKGPLKFFGEKLVPFQRGFESSMDVAGIEMLKAMDHLAIDSATGKISAARIDDLTQFVNEMRGVTSSARLGVGTVQRQLETATLLAPRYNRAIASLLFDLVKGGLRGDQARKKMGTAVLAIGSLSVAISLLMGDEPDEIWDRMNPRSKTFMTWKIGDQNVGPGTKVRSVLKLIGNAWEDPERLKDTSVGWGELEYMKNPIIKFGRGLSAPVIGTSWDLVTGKNFIGEPTTGFDKEGMLGFGQAVVAENMIPIWAQSVLFDGGDPLDRATRGLFEFTGMRAFPRNRLWEADTKWEQELDEYRDIPTDKLELKGKPTRENFRTTNPGIDAKLFITGEVTSLRTFQAINAVVSHILAEEIDPDEIKVIQRRKEERERYAADGTFLPLNSVDRVIQMLDQAEQRRGR